MRTKHGGGRALLATIAIAAGGCAVEAGGTVTGGTVVTPTTGAFTVRWSIDGAFDPNLCAAYAAPTMDVRVLEQASGRLYEQTADCRAFTTTLVLPGGSYTANATLLDPGGHARTTTVTLSAFSLAPGANIVEDADFPRSSFY